MKLNLYGAIPVFLPRDPTGAMEAATKQYVDRSTRTHAQDDARHLTVAENALIEAITVSASEINTLSGITGTVVGHLALKLNLTGGTLSGGLYLASDPTDPNQASTKAYVDTNAALKVAKAGDTLSGFLTLHALPSSAMHAAPKQYVDTTVATHANNADVHVPAGKIDFLNGISITASEANSLLGVTGNVQTQLNAKLPLAGGTLTGALQLAADPATAFQAATKQYVDTHAALKLDLAGGTMSGPIVLSGLPTLDAQAANKQYVDSTVGTHANNDSLHLTPAQNTLLDNLTVSASDLNRVAGLTDSVSNLLATKLDKAGGIVTGDVTFATGSTVFVNKTPVADTELVNKAYVDAKFSALEWHDPVTSIGLISTTIATPPAVPAEDDAYIVGTAPTGAWADKAGCAVVYTKGAWKFLQERAVVAGDRFGVALRSATAVTGELTADLHKLITVVSPTPGAITFSVDSLTSGTTTLVFDQDAPDFGVTYTYSDAGTWVPTNTSVNLTAGAGLQLVGSLLNVVPGAGVSIDGGNAVQVALASGGALVIDGNSHVAVVVDGSTVVKTGGQLSVAPAVMTVVNDAVTKSGTSTVTGSVTFSAGAGLHTTSAPSGNTDVTNKLYVDTVDQGLRTDLTTLQSTVATLNADAVTKGYVDTQDALKLNLTGGTLTGALQLAADPSSALQASTKQYVDSTLSTHATDASLHLTAGQNTLLDALTVSATELNYTAGLTSAAQIQLDARLLLAGGTMTGPISLAADPSANAHATSKSYVDNQVATRLPLAGGTMTGPIVLSADPVTALQPASKQYVDSGLSSHALNDARHLTVDQNTFLDAIIATSVEVNYLSGVTDSVQAQFNAKLELAGGTMTGALTLSGAPLSNLQAATKQYVDQNTTNKLPLAGGTLTGSLLLSGAPVVDAEAANKQYVDSTVSTSATALTTAVNNCVAKAGDAMTGFLTLHAAPTSDMHAATKKFVDDSVANSAAATGTALATTNGNVTQLRTDVNLLMFDPVTKNYVDTQDAGRIAKAGDTMTGFLTLHSDPQSPMHAVPKQYVDAIAQGLSTKPAVRLATVTNLAGTYNNGTAGVNATITGAINGALVIDTVIPQVGDRILLTGQTNKANNGDYTVQQVGNGATPFILKRVPTVDESSEIPGAYFYIYDGATLKGTGWTFVVDNPVTYSIGNDSIYVNQFSGQGSIIAGNGMILTGNTLDIVAADPTRITVTADAIDLTPTGVTPGLYTKVQVDGYGRVTTATNPTTLAGYNINDAQPLNQNLTKLSGVSTKGLLTMDAAGNAQTRAVTTTGTGLTVSNGDGATGDIVVSSNATAAATAGTVVARDASGNFSANVITAALTGNASTATALQNSRTFSVTGDVAATPVGFNGTGNVVLDTALSTTGVTAGTYTKVTVDAKGRISLGENPTTLAGYGIIDGATIDYVSAQIAALEQRMDALYAYVMTRI